MRLLGILLVVLVCTTCTSLYFLTGAHREVSVLRAELEHGERCKPARQLF